MSFNGQAPFPRTPVERELERLQRKVSEGALADERRRQLLVEMYEQGMTQVELAARLTRAATAVGDRPVGLDGVQKLIKRTRMKRARERT